MYTSSKNVILEAIEAEQVKKLFVADGSKGRSKELVDLAREKNIPIVETDRGEIKELSGKAATVAAEIEREKQAGEVSIKAVAEKGKANEKTPLILVLDGITDVHNMGAILRSAFYFGVTAVVLPKDGSAPINKVVYETSAGAAAKIPVVKVTNVSRALDELKECGYWVYATDIDGDKVLSELKFDGPTVFVMGSEDKGVRPGVLSNSDFRVSIKGYNDFDSLNVSAATAVVLYAWRAGVNF